MLKTVSSVANALGALNYKGTWNASTNTPTLASGVGTQGDYYVVSVDGATNLDGITNWGVGDWAAFNGSVWQRVEGGADGNFVNLTAGSATIDQNAVALAFKVTGGNGGLNVAEFIRDIGADTTVGINGSGGDAQIYFQTTGNTFAIGTNSTVFEIADNNAIGTNTRLSISNVGDVSVSTGNLVIGTSGKGIDFSATAGTGTSELLSDYEEGVWSGGLNLYGGVGTVTEERYTKIGNLVIASCNVGLDGTADGSGFIINGLPFTPLGSSSDAYGCTINYNTGNEPTAKGLIFGGTASIKIVTNTKSEISYTTFQNGSACELSLTAIYYA